MLHKTYTGEFDTQRHENATQYVTTLLILSHTRKLEKHEFLYAPLPARAHACAPMCAHVRVCVRACPRACVRVRACACVRVCACARVRVYARACAALQAPCRYATCYAARLALQASCRPVSCSAERSGTAFAGVGGEGGRGDRPLHL